jgi:uncharacterized protein (DUF58 family)
MPRPQFTLRMLLVVMLVVAAFFGGIRFERERRRREEAAGKATPIRLNMRVLKRGKIEETYDKFDVPRTIEGE